MDKYEEKVCLICNKIYISNAGSNRSGINKDHCSGCVCFYYFWKKDNKHERLVCKNGSICLNVMECQSCRYGKALKSLNIEKETTATNTLVAADDTIQIVCQICKAIFVPSQRTLERNAPREMSCCSACIKFFNRHRTGEKYKNFICDKVDNCDNLKDCDSCRFKQLTKTPGFNFVNKQNFEADAENEKNYCKLCAYEFSTVNAKLVKRSMGLIYCSGCIKFAGECFKDEPKVIEKCKNKNSCKDLRTCRSCRFKKLEFCEEYNHVFEKAKMFFSSADKENQPNHSNLGLVSTYPKRIKTEHAQSTTSCATANNTDEKIALCQTIGCDAKLYLPNMNNNALEKNYCNFCQNFYFKWMHDDKYLQLKCINMPNVSCRI